MPRAKGTIATTGGPVTVRWLERIGPYFALSREPGAPRGWAHLTHVPTGRFVVADKNRATLRTFARLLIDSGADWSSPDPAAVLTPAHTAAYDNAKDVAYPWLPSSVRHAEDARKTREA